jgi:NagD protein
MMRSTLRYLGEHSENAVMVGDRMDTDIKMGLESGLETVLVLSGVTKPEMIAAFPYKPSRVVNSVADLEL